MSTLLKNGTDLKAVAKEYLDIFANDKDYLKYRKQETDLQDLIGKCPYNTNFDEVFNKVKMLNSYYSTRMSKFGIQCVTKRICSIKDFDKRIATGDIKLLLEIATPTGEGENKCFSFATKYCVLHSSENYVIHDNMARTVLRKFIDEGLISDFTAYDSDGYLKDINRYKRYIEVSKELQERCGISTLRDVDWFLWAYGKTNNKK